MRREAEAELRREIVEAEECKCKAALRLEEDRKVVEMQQELEKLQEAERCMVEEIRRVQVSLSRMVEAMEVDIEDGGNGGAKSPEGTEDEEEEEEAKTKKGKEGGWMGDCQGVGKVQGVPERGHALYNQSAPD